VTAKIRIFPDDIGLTVSFARELEAHGVAAIAVHGRAGQRDKHSTVATEAIKAVVEAVSIPVIANGGVGSLEDVEAILRETGAAAVMVGQALMRDPTALDPRGRSERKEYAREYLRLARANSVAIGYVRKHVFQFFEDVMRSKPGISEKVTNAQTIEELEAFVEDIIANT
jgi:tRNA-dihydrouridine synthase 1